MRSESVHGRCSKYRIFPVEHNFGLAVCSYFRETHNSFPSFLKKAQLLKGLERWIWTLMPKMKGCCVVTLEEKTWVGPCEMDFYSKSETSAARNLGLRS